MARRAFLQTERSLIEVIKVIESFLTDQTFKTKIEDISSTIRQILTGVLRGSCLRTFYLTCQQHTQNFYSLTCFVHRRIIFLPHNKNVKCAAIQLQQQLNLLLTFSFTDASESTIRKI